MSTPTREQAQRYLNNAEFHAKAKTLARIIQEALPDTSDSDALDIGIVGAAVILAAPAEGWTEHRVIYGRPASYLEKNPLRMEDGFSYVVERTGPHPTREEARRHALYRAEESHAWIIGYETRQAGATDWEKQP